MSTCMLARPRMATCNLEDARLKGSLVSSEAVSHCVSLGPWRLGCIPIWLACVRATAQCWLFVGTTATPRFPRILGAWGAANSAVEAPPEGAPGIPASPQVLGEVVMNWL